MYAWSDRWLSADGVDQGGGGGHRAISRCEYSAAYRMRTRGPTRRRRRCRFERAERRTFDFARALGDPLVKSRFARPISNPREFSRRSPNNVRRPATHQPSLPRVLAVSYPRRTHRGEDTTPFFLLCSFFFSRSFHSRSFLAKAIFGASVTARDFNGS